MYCGDETGSFIGDIGSHVSRFGYGGEDSPKYVVPSYTSGTALVPSCLNHRWSTQTVKQPLRSVQEPMGHPVVDPAEYLQQGDTIEDWDALEQTWQSALEAMQVTNTLKHSTGGKPKQTVAASGIISTTIQGRPIYDGKCIHPILAVSPGCTRTIGISKYAADSFRRKQLVQLTEIMMEKLDTKAFFLAPSPMLAAFSHGRQTALIVDIGAGGTRVTPIIDGLVVEQAQRRTGRGGDWLGNVQWKALLDQKTIMRPRYQLRALGNATQGKGIFHRWAMQDLMYEFRSSEHVKLPSWWQDPTVPFVYSDAAKEDGADNDGTGDKMDVDMPAQPLSTISTTTGESTYELPDGTLIDLTSKVGKDMCRIPELFFTDKIPFLPGFQAANQTILNEHHTICDMSLPRLIHASLSAVGDVDARKDLAGSILLTGGSSQFAILEQRLSLEIPRIVSSAYKCRVVASKYNIERSCAAWIGGSILSSLGSFQQLWLSRAEYDEYGATLAIQRFP
jgi:actin-related protein